MSTTGQVSEPFALGSVPSEHPPPPVVIKRSGAGGHKMIEVAGVLIGVLLP